MNSNKNIFLVLGPVLFLGSAFAKGTDCSVGKVVENRKEPIAFQPFEMINPENGKAYLPNDMIQVPDEGGQYHNMSAREYFSKLNSMEKKINLWGYSLRADSDVEISKIAICIDKLKQQSKVLDGFISEKVAQFYRSGKEQLEKWNRASDEYLKDMPSWQELQEIADDETYDFYMPEVPVYKVHTPVFERKDIAFDKEKRYQLAQGSSENFSVKVNPYYKIGSSRTQVVGEAGIEIDGAILGKWQGSIADVKIHGASPSHGPLKLDLTASAVDGRKVWRKPITKSGQIRSGDKFRESVIKEISFRFSAGPIPMKAAVGLRGEIGFQWGIDMYPLQLGLHTGPWAAVDAYAEVGADITLAGVGSGGRLRIIEGSLNLQGSGAYGWKEGVDEPEIQLELALNTELLLLSGDLYGYAYIYYPVLWPPWKKKAIYRQTFFDWEGFKKEGTLFDYRATFNRNGLVAEGDLSPEDFLERNQINAEFYIEELEQAASEKSQKIVDAIMSDLKSGEFEKIDQDRATIIALVDEHSKRLNELGRKVFQTN